MSQSVVDNQKEPEEKKTISLFLSSAKIGIGIKPVSKPGSNNNIVSCNASALIHFNATSSLVRFENQKKSSGCYEKML
jgi:hypothetical protein